MIVNWMKQATSGLRDAGLVASMSTAPSMFAASAHAFVRSSGNLFVLESGPPVMTGVNSCYLTFASREKVLRVHDDAVAMGAKRVRTFLQADGARIRERWKDPNRELRNRGGAE